MAIEIKHPFQSAKSDGADNTVVQPSDWNAAHNITLAASRLLGRATASAGAAEEISLAGGLAFDPATTSLRLQASVTARLFGRFTAGGGAAEEISLGTGLTLSAGGVLSASAGLWTNIIKAADEVKTNSAVLADDDALVFAMLANQKYVFSANIFVRAIGTSDFKYRFTGPAGAALVRINRHFEYDSSDDKPDFMTAYDIVDVTQNQEHFAIIASGIIHNGATAGNFAFRWAQGSSDPSATTVYAGSSMDYAQV